MAVNFKELLSKKADDVTKPPIFPAGTYRGIIRPGFTFGESSQKKTPFVEYQISLIEPHEGVDTDELIHNGQPIDITKKVFKKAFYLTDAALYQLKDFIASCGVETEGRSMDELVPEPIGAAVLCDIIQKPNQAGTDFYNELAQVVGEGA